MALTTELSGADAPKANALLDNPGEPITFWESTCPVERVPVICALCPRERPGYSPVESWDFTPLRIALLSARSIANKSFVLKDLIMSKKLDFLFLTEILKISKMSLSSSSARWITFLSAHPEFLAPVEDVLWCSGVTSYVTWWALGRSLLLNYKWLKLVLIRFTVF